MLLQGLWTAEGATSTQPIGDRAPGSRRIYAEETFDGVQQQSHHLQHSYGCQKSFAGCCRSIRWLHHGNHTPPRILWPDETGEAHRPRHWRGCQLVLQNPEPEPKQQFLSLIQFYKFCNHTIPTPSRPWMLFLLLRRHGLHGRPCFGWRWVLNGLRGEFRHLFKDCIIQILQIVFFS